MNKLTILVLLANLSIDTVQSIQSNAHALSGLTTKASTQEKLKLEQTLSLLQKS
jgi:hypothetical protein